MHNILILNAGTRTKLVEYFVRECRGKNKVIATDNYFLAPAIYKADKWYCTKRWDETGYWEDIITICEQEEIGLIVSVFDPELIMLSKMQKFFQQKGILVNTSETSVIETCMDKFKMIQFLKEHELPYIPTFKCSHEVIQAIEQKEIEFPIFMKPRLGSGSVGITILHNMNELEAIKEQSEGMIFQEYMSGSEFGVDVYIDFVSNEVVSIFTKKKLKMRAGETDKSISYKDQKLFDLINSFVLKLGLKGANDIDVFEKNGEYYISEVNPRFGGGYLHAYECGENFPLFLINNMDKHSNVSNIGHYEEDVYMMKYFDISIMKK